MEGKREPQDPLGVQSKGRDSDTDNHTEATAGGEGALQGVKVEQHLRAYKEANGPLDVQLLEDVNLFGLKGMRLTKVTLRSNQSAHARGMKIVEYETKRVKPITAAEFLSTFIPETMRLTEKMEAAFGRVDRVEVVITMILEAMIISYEAVDGKRFPNQVAATHIRDRLKQIYKERGVELPDDA